MPFIEPFPVGKRVSGVRNEFLKFFRLGWIKPPACEGEGLDWLAKAWVLSFNARAQVLVVQPDIEGFGLLIFFSDELIELFDEIHSIICWGSSCITVCIYDCLDLAIKLSAQ